MSKEWHSRVSLVEALDYISEDLNLPKKDAVIRVDIDALADKGTESERIVKGYVLLKMDGSEITVTEMIFTN